MKSIYHLMSSGAPIRTTIGSQLHSWTGPSRRRVPRFLMQSPVDVTVLRSGIPDTFPGRLLNICERGLGAMLAGDLAPGETVGVEMLLSTASEPVRARATVRYHSRLQYGLEFMGLSAEQRAAIREWARGTKAETGDGISLSAVADVVRPATPEAVSSVPSPPSGPRSPRKKMHTVSWLVFTVVLVSALAAFWWKWSRSWRELESTLNTSQAEAIKPQAQVPAEMMQRLLLHRVEPIYPRDARKQKLQAIIALDIIVGQDGSVIRMRPLNGPDLLARSAMDALRWWKFEPFRINGEPAIVETTIAVEFKP